MKIFNIIKKRSFNIKIISFITISILFGGFISLFAQAAVVEYEEKSEFEKKHIRKSQREAVTIEKVLTNSSAAVTLNNWDRRIELIGMELPDFKELQKYFDSGQLPKEELEYHKSEYNKARGALKDYVNKGDVLFIEQDVRKKNAFGNLLVYLYSPNRRIINVEIIKQGYAYPVRDIDNKVYEKEMFDALEYAIDHKNGLYKIWELKYTKDKKSEDKKGKVIIDKIIIPDVR